MHLRRICFALLTASSVLFSACTTPESQDSADNAEAMAASQVAHGAEVFAGRCASCHGNAGQGTRKAPPLVGEGALPLLPREDQVRERPFHTALDIAVFATEAMPPKESVRAEMKTADHWAVLAFALTANGVKLDHPVNADNASAIVLHP